VQDNWTKINRAITEALENIPLSEMLGPPTEQA